MGCRNYRSEGTSIPRRPVQIDGSFPAECHPAPVSERRSEAAAISLAERGLRAAAVRLAPSVHGVGETHGFLPLLIRKARETGVSACLADGQNRWSGVNRLNAARVFRLAPEHGVTASGHHAVADEAVGVRNIAMAIGRRLGLPSPGGSANTSAGSPPWPALR